MILKTTSTFLAHSSLSGRSSCFLDVAVIRHRLLATQVFVFALLLGTPIALAQGWHQDIVKTGDLAPDGDGLFSTFDSLPQLDNSGAIGLRANLSGATGGASGIFYGGNGSVTQIARMGQVVGSGSISTINIPGLNDSGTAMFLATVSGKDTMLRGSGGALTQIVQKGDAAPDLDGTIDRIFGSTVNTAGQYGGVVWLTGTSGGSSNDRGVILGSGGALTQVAREGQAAPDAIGNFTNFSNAVTLETGEVGFSASLTGSGTGLFRGNGGGLTQIARNGQATSDGTIFNLSNEVYNSSGQAAFESYLTGTSGGALNDRGLFRAHSGAITRIVQEGQAAPDSNGTIGAFQQVRLNDSGQVSFVATLNGTSGGSLDNGAIYRGSGGALTQLVHKGVASPDNIGTFFTFPKVSLNNSGQVAFESGLYGAGVTPANSYGIYTGDGVDLIQVVRMGESLAGSTITSVLIDPKALNDAGQIAYRANLANGSQHVRVWTPDLHWRGSSSGTWESSGAWTLGLNPSLVHDVYLNPAASLTVTGPSSNQTIHSLTVGDGVGAAILSLQSGVTLTATNGVTIGANGTLGGEGTIIGDIVNNGTFLPTDLNITGNLSLNPSTNSFFNLGGTGVGEFDQLVVSGDLQLDGNLMAGLTGAFSLAPASSFEIIKVGGTLSGTFQNLAGGDFVANLGGIDLFIKYSNSNSVVLFTAVPEPTGISLLMGFLSVFVWARRRRSPA